ncbi:hypothetical protein [Flavobacterium phycosphaerae]|uniref:hypothetical protein n=1 Tax=Flavobacterium phycosphaerae TaxID=2697515 RepID=UPI00138A367F|nr:hypothetical protein [Flavobacterium phycosphaerae]
MCLFFVWYSGDDGSYRAYIVYSIGKGFFALGYRGQTIAIGASTKRNSAFDNGIMTSIKDKKSLTINMID